MVAILTGNLYMLQFFYFFPSLLFLRILIALIIRFTIRLTYLAYLSVSLYTEVRVQHMSLVFAYSVTNTLDTGEPKYS